MPTRKNHCRNAVARLLAVFVLGIVATTLVTAEGSPETDATFAENLHTWRKERLERLTSPDGWLTLAGLYWLEEGVNRCGSDPKNELVFPAGSAPARVGFFMRQGEVVEFEPAPGVAVTSNGQPIAARVRLESDATGAPTHLQLGSLDFHLIRRGDRFGIRLKDSQSPLRLHFPGIDQYPPSRAWKIVARFEPHVPPKRISIPNALGTVSEEESPGVVVFERDGVSYRIDAMLGSDDELFLVFGDRTNGKQTYGGGRFLYAEPADAQGRVVLDFNRAYNPPCAFTPYATCPLPPPQNKLALAIEAGERKFAGGGH